MRGARLRALFVVASVACAAPGCKPRPRAHERPVAASVVLEEATVLANAELLGAKWTASGDVIVVTARDVVRLWPRDPSRKRLLFHMRSKVLSFATATREDATVVGLDNGALYTLRGDEMKHVADVDIAHEVEISEDGFVLAAQGISETWFFDALRGELRGRKRPRTLRLSPSGRWAMAHEGVWSTEGDLGPSVTQHLRARPLAWIGERALFAEDGGMIVVEPETQRHTRISIPCTGPDAVDLLLRRVVRVCSGRVYFVGIDPLTRSAVDYATPPPPFEWSSVSFSARSDAVTFSVVGRTSVERFYATPQMPSAVPSVSEESYRDETGRAIGYQYATAEDPFPAPGFLPFELYVRKDDVRVVPRGSDRVVTRVGADPSLFERGAVP